MMRTTVAALVVLGCVSAALAAGLSPEQQRALYDKVVPSLVVVQYDIDGEFGRRELMGQGVVVKEEGVVLTSIALFPVAIPDAHFKNFKIVIPGDEGKEFDAEFL